MPLILDDISSCDVANMNMESVHFCTQIRVEFLESVVSKSLTDFRLISVSLANFGHYTISPKWQNYQDCNGCWQQHCLETYPLGEI